MVPFWITYALSAVVGLVLAPELDTFFYGHRGDNTVSFFQQFTVLGFTGVVFLIWKVWLQYVRWAILVAVPLGLVAFTPAYLLLRLLFP